MNRDSYEKQLIKQKIEAHRDISRLEWESLRANNPVASAFSLGASVTSLLGGRGGTLLKSTSVASIPALIYAVVRLWRRRASRADRTQG
jgi:hypothetical protein